MYIRRAISSKVTRALRRILLLQSASKSGGANDSISSSNSKRSLPFPEEVYYLYVLKCMCAYRAFRCKVGRMASYTISSVRA